MNRIRKWTLGTIGAAALVVAGLTGGAVYAQDATPTSPLAPPANSVLQPANGQANSQTNPQSEQETALAAALGITVDELQAAEQSARAAALAQAVTDGKITQEQADQMVNGPGGLGRGADQQYLADALGITLDELQAAQDKVQADQLAQAVADGKLTQEQADEITARQKLQRYLADQMQAAYAAGVQQAVSDGVITQEQADEFVDDFHWSIDGGALGGGMDAPGGGPIGSQGQAGLPPGGAPPSGAPPAAATAQP